MTRPDDGDGAGFLRALRRLRARLSGTSGGPLPALVWVPARPDLDGNVERSETCEAGEHRLLVVQMRDSYLSSQPQAMPRVSWSVYRGLEIIVGGSAPTLDDARARVELMWRTLAGLKGS